MITLATNLDSFDQEALASFLESDRSPPDCMGVSDLDGFLTGIAIGPETIMPSEWLATVWGGEAPTFADRDEGETILGMIMVRHNEILRDIEDGKCGPIFWEATDGTVVAADWAHGFRQAIKLRQDAWAGMLASKRDSALLFPILALCGDADGNSLLGLTREQEDTMLEAAPGLIPGCVLAISVYWRARARRRHDGRAAAQPSRAAAKTGRNDPCPCGSGKKFKRCCGQGGSAGPLSSLDERVH